MKIYCPHCGVKGSADDSYSGRKIKCPKCQGMFDLTSDMAIDQSEFPAAPAEETLNLAESMAEESPQETSAPALDFPDEISPFADEEEDETDPFLDLPKDRDYEVAAGESAEDEDLADAEELDEEDEDSIDWDDFGAELDKEIAENEMLAEKDELAVLESTDTDEGPVAALNIESDDFQDVEIRAEREGRLDENDLSADLGNLLHGRKGELEEIIEEPEVAGLDTDGFEKNTLATLTARKMKESRPADDTAAEAAVETEEVPESMAFAEEDLPDDDREEDDAEVDVIIGDEVDEVIVIEDEPYGIDKEQCWQCGKKDSVGEPFIAVDGRLYCTDCLPAEELEEMASTTDGAHGVAALAGKEQLAEDRDGLQSTAAEEKKRFTVGGVIKEAWEGVKGVKGAIWAGSAIMYLVLIVIIAGGALLMPSTGTEGSGLTGYILPAVYQVVTQVVSMLFIAGLLFMGIRKVAGDVVSWKMIFHGFSFTGKIIIVTILQFILISIGFLLLILPGIYLTVGYAMAIPLIVDKNLSPWEALETSRKEVHKVWWKVACLYLVMSLLCLVATIPLGIGLIWVWPMIMVAAGVVYHRLFGK